jgi:CO/xanthine dehydrogenase Mo-binding subunit
MIGRPVRRREDLPLMRGAGRYVDDLDIPGLAHVVFVRSHHARARIAGVCAPSSAPGLLRVLTAADLVGRARPLPVIEPAAALVADLPHPILAADEVRYAGQPVAAVVAESRAQAVDAAEALEVEYEELDAVVDPRRAPETLMRWERMIGAVDGVLDGAAHRVCAEYRIPRLVAAPIEPRGVVAAYDEAADLLTVWASAQDPHRPLAQLAHALDRPADRLRVVVPDVGGAFGSKGVIAVEAVVVAVAAMELGRPVKWIEDRVENSVGAYQGRGVEASVELGLNASGRQLGKRSGVSSRRWTRDRAEWVLSPRPGPRDDVRPDPRRPARGQDRRDRAAVRRQRGRAGRRRHVREPVGGDGRLGAPAGGRSDRGAGVICRSRAARLPGRRVDARRRSVGWSGRPRGDVGRGRLGRVPVDAIQRVREALGVAGDERLAELGLGQTVLEVWDEA